MNIRIEIKGEAVQRALQRLLVAGNDLSPVMRRVATHLTQITEDAFEHETAPDGTPWAEHSDTTIARRGGGARKLQQDRHLLNSILANWDKDTAVAGTNVPYAATHQFGAKQGEFGSTKRGGPIPWGDIPARPFLGIPPTGERAIENILVKFIDQQWR